MKKFAALLIIFISSLSYSQFNGWEYVGPKKTEQQIKGYFGSIWVDEFNTNFALAGSSAGGLFVTENANDSLPQWINLMDHIDEPINGVNDIVVIPKTNHQTIYISTLTYCGGINQPQGAGILKTTDGGKTWANVGPQKGNRNPFFGLVANPLNESEMLAYNQHSVYVTNDGWETFKSIDIPLAKDITWFFCDAEFAPYVKGKAYVCLRTNSRNEAKILELNLINNAFKDITPLDLKAERIELETVLNPKFANKFYIAYGSENVRIRYFNGKEFSKDLNQPFSHAAGGTYWNFEFKVNPVDTNIMYVGLTECSRSKDGGKTFEKIANYNMLNMHADVRGMFLLPNDKLYIANDGGISLLKNSKDIQWRSLNGNGLDGNQFFGAGVLQSDSLFIAAGAQDNGGFFITDHKTQNNMYNCGDGYQAEVLDEQHAIINCNGSSSYLYHRYNGYQVYLSFPDPYFGKREIFIQDSFVYTGYRNIWRAKIKDLINGKTNFTNLTNFKDFKNQQNVIRNQHLNSFDVRPNSEAIVAFGLPNWEDPKNIGKVLYFKSIEKKDIDPIDLTEQIHCKGLVINRWFEINTIKFDLTVENKFYITAHDYFDYQSAFIYEVLFNPDSATCQLKEINYNLPKTGIPCLKINQITGDLYLGTHTGVYYKTTEDTLWTKLNFKNKSLPNVFVYDLDFNYHSNLLYATTHARGIWRCYMPSDKTNNVRFKSAIIKKEISLNGRLEIARKAKVELKNKLFLYPGSKVKLNRNATLIISKELVRNHLNQIEDINKYLIKNKTSKLIIK
jgi:photosystem II stability/assembly factor-like uncharacterized protein